MSENPPKSAHYSLLLPRHSFPVACDPQGLALWVSRFGPFPDVVRLSVALPLLTCADSRTLGLAKVYGDGTALRVDPRFEQALREAAYQEVATAGCPTANVLHFSESPSLRILDQVIREVAEDMAYEAERLVASGSTCGDIMTPALEVTVQNARKAEAAQKEQEMRTRAAQMEQEKVAQAACDASLDAALRAVLTPEELDAVYAGEHRESLGGNLWPEAAESLITERLLPFPKYQKLQEPPYRTGRFVVWEGEDVCLDLAQSLAVAEKRKKLNAHLAALTPTVEAFTITLRQHIFRTNDPDPEPEALGLRVRLVLKGGAVVTTEIAV